MSDDVDEIGSFIASMQARPGHRMAIVGLQAGEIADQIREFDVGFVKRHQDGALVAVMGVDYDADLRRVWLYGPFVTDEDVWADIADGLWREVRPRLPPVAKEVDVGYAADNERAAAFAARHGFEVFSEGSSMAFPRERLSDLPESPNVRPLLPRERDEVARLHTELFPDVWPNAPQMFERLNEHRRVFVASDDGFTGYLHAEVKPDHGEGFIEFVGVDEGARGRGVAKQLVAAAVRWMLSFEEMDVIELYVRDENAAAQRVYSAVGFTAGPKLVGARLRF